MVLLFLVQEMMLNGWAARGSAQVDRPVSSAKADA